MEQTKSLIRCKDKYSSYRDYMCMKDRQSRKWVWETIRILWSVDLGENGRTCSHFELDTEKNTQNHWSADSQKTEDRTKSTDVGQTWQDRQNSSPITTQTFPKCFSLKGSLSHQLFCLFHEALYIELCIPIANAWSQVFRDSGLP